MSALDEARLNERAKSESTTLFIPLSLLQDLIAEIERLQAQLQEAKSGKEAAVHGRPGLRSVGGDEG